MTTWIVSTGEAWKKMPELRRSAIRHWLSMNGVNPNRVPVDCEVVVRENSDGIWVIDFDEYLTDENGRIRFDPNHPEQAHLATRTVPMDIDLPLYLMSGSR